MDPFGAFFDVMLRDMLGTIPGGEEFLASVLGMAGRSGTGFPSFEPGDLCAASSATCEANISGGKQICCSSCSAGLQRSSIHHFDALSHRRI